MSIFHSYLSVVSFRNDGEMLKFNFIEFSEGTLETRINQQILHFSVSFRYFLHFAIDGPRTRHRPKQNVHFILYTKKNIFYFHLFGGKRNAKLNIKWMNVFYVPKQ